MAAIEFLAVRGKYESAIDRKGLSFRSPRLDAVVAAVDTYILNSSSGNLDTVERALTMWERTNPKEFKDRGLPIKSKMAGEIQLIRVKVLSDRNQVAIPILNPQDHPQYEPRLWNNEPFLTSTNCYAYACNSRVGHFIGEKPQPGSYDRTRPLRQLVKTKADPLQFDTADSGKTSPAVRLAIMRDGQAQGIDKRLIPIIRQPGEPVTNIPGYYLVALVVASGYQVPQFADEEYIRDYHWYRQDRDGTWSHKPGHSQATNLDGSDDRIYDPRVCNMTSDFWANFGNGNTLYHIHYEFVMFFYCPKGGVTVGMQQHIPKSSVRQRGRAASF